nr:ScpA family protein [Deinococcus pimensis]
MTSAAPAAPADVETVFVARAGTFEGSLAELASALRAGKVRPAEVPLLALTREVLARAGALREARVEASADLLPPLAAVIALKARLLLPRVEPEDTPDDGDGDDFVEEIASGVDALAELDVLVGFLARRRQERQHLVPARAVDLGLPRRERRAPSGGLAKLVKAARQAVREVSVPLLARERTTLADALVALRAYASRLRHFVFGGVTVADWGERTTYFGALLEGVKDGDFAVTQTEPYGAIEVRDLRGGPSPDDGPQS